MSNNKNINTIKANNNIPYDSTHRTQSQTQSYDNDQTKTPELKNLITMQYKP